MFMFPSLHINFKLFALFMCLSAWLSLIGGVFEMLAFYWLACGHVLRAGSKRYSRHLANQGKHATGCETLRIDWRRRKLRFDQELRLPAVNDCTSGDFWRSSKIFLFSSSEIELKLLFIAKRLVEGLSL